MFKPTYLDAVYDLLDIKVNGGSEAGPIAEISLHEGETAPTEETIQAKLAELISAYNAQEYARNRALEYPSLLELTVALYDTDDKSAVEAKRASVKLKYPKPS
mgnify:CR=1 FL=1